MVSYLELSLEAGSHSRLCGVAASEIETQSAEATVLFHIHQSARFGHASIRNFLKFMKSVANAPELVLDPFFLTVLLSLSSISIYEEQVSICFFRWLVVPGRVSQTGQDKWWRDQMLGSCWSSSLGVEHMDKDHITLYIAKCIDG
jgi:hypothetical protein